MSRNRLTGDASKITVLPNAAGAYNENVLDDFLIVAPGSLVGTHTVQLNGSLAANPIPADGDEVTISDPAGMISTATPLVLVGRIGALGAQLRDGSALADSLTYTSPGVNKRLVYSLETNSWNVMNGGTSTSGGTSAGALAVTDWYWDPAGTSGGSDVNTGRVAGLPCRTFAHIATQWGFGILNPGPGGSVVVHQLSANTAADPVAFILAGLGPSVSMLIQGTATTIFGPSTFTAVTVKNRLSAGGGNALQVTDPTQAGGWTNYRLNGSSAPARVRDTTNNSISWVMRDLGGNIARLSDQLTPTAVVANNYPQPNNAQRPAAVAAIGDSYVIESVPNCFLGEIVIEGSDATSGGAAGGFSANTLAFQNVATQRVSGGSRDQPSLGGNIAYVHYECFIGENVENKGNTSGIVAFVNCGLRRQLTGTGGSYQIFGGMAVNPPQTGVTLLFMDMDFMLQGAFVGVAAGNTAKIGTCAVFDNAAPFATGPNNPSGDAFHIMPGGAITNQTLNDTTHQLWGNGTSVGKGYGGSPNSVLAIEANIPNVSAVAGDFTLGGLTSSRGVDDTGAAPVYTALIPNTWANMAVALPAGFGGSAQAVGNGARILLGIS